MVREKYVIYSITSFDVVFSPDLQTPILSIKIELEKRLNLRRMYQLVTEVVSQSSSRKQVVSGAGAALHRLVAVSQCTLVIASVDMERTAVHVKAIPNTQPSSMPKAKAARDSRRVTLLDDDEPGRSEGSRQFWTPKRCAGVAHTLRLAQHAGEGHVSAIELLADDWTSECGEARRVHLLVGTTTGCVLWCSAVSGTVVCVAALPVDVTARQFVPSTDSAGMCGVVQFLVSRSPSAIFSARTAAAGRTSAAFALMVVFSNGTVIEVHSDASEQICSALALGDATVLSDQRDLPARPTLLDWDSQTSSAPFPVAGPAAQVLVGSVTVRNALSLPPQAAIFSCALCDRFATEILDVFDGTGDTEKTLLVVGSSPAFSSFKFHREVETLTKAQVVAEIASRVTGAAMGLVKSFWRGSSAASQKPLVKALSVSTLHPKMTMFPADLSFVAIDVDPSNSYAACYASTGRLYVFDLASGSVWKIFKGCRSAQFQWIVGAADARKMLCLAILLPLRRVMEVFALQTRTRIAAVAFPTDCSLVPRTPLASAADMTILHILHADDSLTRWRVVTRKKVIPLDAVDLLSSSQVLEKKLDTFAPDFEQVFGACLKQCNTADSVFSLLLSVPLVSADGQAADRGRLVAAHEAAAHHVRGVFAPSAADSVLLPSPDQKQKTAAQVLNFAQLRGTLLATLFDVVLNGPPKAGSRSSLSSQSILAGAGGSAAPPSSSSFWSSSSSTPASAQPASGRSFAPLALRLRTAGTLAGVLDQVALSALRRVLADLSAADSPPAASFEKCTPVQLQTVVSFFWSGGHKNRILMEIARSCDDNVDLFGRAFHLAETGIEGLPALGRPFSVLGISSTQAVQLAVHWTCISDPCVGLTVSSTNADTLFTILSVMSPDDLSQVVLPLRLDLSHSADCLRRLRAASVILALRLDDTASVKGPKRTELTRMLSRLLHLEHFIRSTPELQEAVADRSPPVVVALSDLSPYGKESFTAFLIQNVWPTATAWPKLAAPLECPSATLRAVFAVAEEVISIPGVAARLRGEAALTAVKSAKDLVFADFEQKAWKKTRGTDSEVVSLAEISLIFFCSVVVAVSHCMRAPLLLALREVISGISTDLEVTLLKHLAGDADAGATGRSRMIGKYLQQARDFCELEIEVASVALRSSCDSEGGLLLAAQERIANFSATDRADSLFPVCSLRALHAASHLPLLVPAAPHPLSSFTNLVMEYLFERRTLLQLLQWNMQHINTRVDWAAFFSPLVLSPEMPQPLSVTVDASIGCEKFSAQREQFVKQFCSASPPPSREEAETLRVLLGVGTSDLVSLELFEHAVVAANVAEMQARMTPVSNRAALAKVALRLLHDVCRTVLKETLSASARLQQAAGDSVTKAARLQAAGLAQRVEGALTGPVLQWVRSRAPLAGPGGADAAETSNRALVAALKVALGAGGSPAGPQLGAYLSASHVLAGICAAEGTSLGNPVLMEVALEMPSVIRSLSKILVK